MSRNTCDKCVHYTPSKWGGHPNCGECALMGDSNDTEGDNDADKCAGWDGEGYSAGVYVGPKFGCIHFLKVAA